MGGGNISSLLSPESVGVAMFDPAGVFYKSKNQDILERQAKLDIGGIGAKPVYNKMLAEQAAASVQKPVTPIDTTAQDTATANDIARYEASRKTAARRGIAANILTSEKGLGGSTAMTSASKILLGS